MAEFTMPYAQTFQHKWVKKKAEEGGGGEMCAEESAWRGGSVILCAEWRNVMPAAQQEKITCRPSRAYQN